MVVELFEGKDFDSLSKYFLATGDSEFRANPTELNIIVCRKITILRAANQITSTVKAIF